MKYLHFHSQKHCLSKSVMLPLSSLTFIRALGEDKESTQQLAAVRLEPAINPLIMSSIIILILVTSLFSKPRSLTTSYYGFNEVIKGYIN